MSLDVAKAWHVEQVSNLNEKSQWNQKNIVVVKSLEHPSGWNHEQTYWNYLKNSAKRAFGHHKPTLQAFTLSPFHLGASSVATQQKRKEDTMQHG